VHYVPLADNQGRLIFNHSGDNTWANFAITAAGNPPLAWEFMQYLLQAYYNPRGRAAVDPIWGAPNFWASESLASPILREGFDETVRRGFERAFVFDLDLRFINADTAAGRNEQIDNAIGRIARFNEMPMSILPPMLPDIFGNTIEHFQLGIITPEAAAQQLHNTISLWMMEQN